METTNLFVTKIIGHDACIDLKNAQAVFDALEGYLLYGARVALSFDGVDLVTSAFMNTAIGQLYGEFSPNHIDKCLSVVGLDVSDAAMLAKVQKNAEEYFRNQAEERYCGDV